MNAQDRTLQKVTGGREVTRVRFRLGRSSCGAQPPAAALAVAPNDFRSLPYEVARTRTIAARSAPSTARIAACSSASSRLAPALTWGLPRKTLGL
jgi:hypothetical protein